MSSEDAPNVCDHRKPFLRYDPSNVSLINKMNRRLFGSPITLTLYSKLKLKHFGVLFSYEEVLVLGFHIVYIAAMVVTRSGSQLGNSDMSALSSNQSHSQSFELKEEGEEESFLSPTGATIGSPASSR